MQRKWLYIIALVVICAAIGVIGYYYLNQYWIHRYDDLIARQANVYRLEERLVWSVIYEETYFRGWQIGAANEVGLMQVTPLVAKEWASETGFREFEKQTAENAQDFLLDPERNIQVGCWYLEMLSEKYRGFPGEKAMTLAAYNAGASRVDEWVKGTDPSKLSEKQFIERIDIPSTRIYVSSVLRRFRDRTAGR